MASQQSIDAWYAWATGVLNRIGAPPTPENYRSLWNWSRKESGSDPMNNGAIRNNPLNTTQPVVGSQSVNSVGVQSFPDISSSVNATAMTLTNGRYQHILDALRNSKPAPQWLSFESAIKQELSTWGSGSNWLGWNQNPPTSSMNIGAAGIFGPAPSNVGATSGSNPVSDAINSALGGALGPIGNAISGAEQDLVQKATYVVLMLLGAVLMLVGLGLLGFIALGAAPAPVKRVAGAVASVTPQGRAVAVASAARPKPALSPEASQAVSEAKAGRGSKLSPGVKSELRSKAS